MLAVIAGGFLRSTFYVNVGILGVVAGSALGVLLYSLLAISFSANSKVLLFMFVGAGAVGGGILAWRKGKEIVLYTTSLIGSYIYMRGIAACYGGFPSYAELKAAWNGEAALQNAGAFYGSLAIFLTSFVLSSVWQKYKMSEHESLKIHSSDEITAANDDCDDDFKRVKDEDG